MNLDQIMFSELPSPCYVIDCDNLKTNLTTYKKNCDILGIKPLIAIKGFPLALIYKFMSPYVYGLSASSLFEAKLGKHLGKEIHIHAPAYRPDEIDEVFKHCDHVVFNSYLQWKQYQKKFSENSNSIGLRINPEYSEIDIDKYNSCSIYSRFGITKEALSNKNISGINGFHIHVMYDHDAQTFVRVIDNFINNFSNYLPYLSWINLGGGQCLADSDYPIELLKQNISILTTKFGLDVYVEPCEAIVTGCGYLVTTILDIVNNKKQTAILDCSALCHMPDVLEMPYRPDIEYPNVDNNGKYNYILAGISCLAGDVIGEYKFNNPLQIGGKVVFSEMGAYTFAKENYFNGINLPAIVLFDKLHGYRIAKQFNYQDFESRYL